MGICCSNKALGFKMKITNIMDCMDTVLHLFVHIENIVAAATIFLI